MQSQYIDPGRQIRITPEAAVNAGDVMPWGEGVAIIEAAQEAGRPVGAAIDGTYEFPKATGNGTAFALGAAADWDEDAEKAVAGGTGDRRLGRVTQAASNDDTHVRVKINAFSVVVESAEIED